MGWTSLFTDDDTWGTDWNLFDGGDFGGGGNWWDDFDYGDYADSFDFGDWLGGDSGGDSGGGGWLNTIGNLFGGNSGSGGSGSLWGALLSGLGGAADSWLNEKNIEKMAKEQRKNTSFEAELLDYYKQKDKNRKRYALDNYGQFSLLSKWAPGYTGDRPIEQPAKPSP